MGVEPCNGLAVAHGAIKCAQERTPAAHAIERDFLRQIEPGHAVTGAAGVARDEWLECRAEEAGILPGQEVAVVAHPVRRVDEGRQRIAGRPKLRHDRAYRRKVVGRRGGDQPTGLERLSPGQGEIRTGVVVGDRVMDRADQGQVVGRSGEQGKVLAEREPGHGRGNRLELAADLLGCIGLHVPEVLVSRASFQDEENERLGLGTRRSRGRCEQSGQSQPDHAGRADMEQVATAQAIAESTIAGGDPQHRRADHALYPLGFWTISGSLYRQRSRIRVTTGMFWGLLGRATSRTTRSEGSLVG